MPTSMIRKEVEGSASEEMVSSYQEFAALLLRSCYAGYGVGFIVALVVVLNGLISFKRLVKAIRLDLIKRQLIACSRVSSSFPP